MEKNKTISNFKDIVFNSYLKTTLKKYGLKTNKRVLLKYIESSKFDIDEYIKNTDWNKYLKDDNLLENIENLVEDGTTFMRIRKLTPLECWRLMGFDDEDFYKAKNAGISDTQLYRQAGNSIVVNVLECILKNLI